MINDPKHEEEQEAYGNIMLVVWGVLCFVILGFIVSITVSLITLYISYLK